MKPTAEQLTTLRAAMPDVEISPEGFLLLSTPDTETKEQWGPYCDLQAALRVHGFELDDPYIDHDSIGGELRVFQPTILAPE